MSFSNPLVHRLFEGSSWFCLDLSDNYWGSKPQFKIGYGRFFPKPSPLLSFSFGTSDLKSESLNELQ